MKNVDLYGRVRHAVLIDGMSSREAARVFGVDPRTIAKMLAFSFPPGYRRSQPVRRPKLDAFTGIIDQTLEADKLVPKKQRHTSKRIFERLRDEHDFEGGITIEAGDSVRLTRIKAVNSRERNTKAKLEKALAESDERLSRYLDRLDEADGQDESGTGGGEVENIREKIAAIQGRRERFEEHREVLPQLDQRARNFEDFGPSHMTCRVFTRSGL